MMKIFLAFAFRDLDKELVGHVDRLLASQYVQALTGEGLGGEQLTPAVQARIEECDALIGFLTRRDGKQGGGWTTHQWVLDEIGYARSNHKRAIAIVEDGVDVAGMYQPHEFIPLDRAAPLQAVLRLSETIGQWKHDHGRTVKVQLLPRSLGHRIVAGVETMKCSHRLWLQGKFTAWTEATPVPEEGGTFVHVPGVQDEHLIQIEVRDSKLVWKSSAASQWVSITLTTGGRKR